MHISRKINRLVVNSFSKLNGRPLSKPLPYEGRGFDSPFQRRKMLPCPPVQTSPENRGFDSPFPRREGGWGVRSVLFKFSSFAFFSLLFVTLATPGFSQQPGLNFISEVKGKVEIKKPEWKQYQRAYGGELLNPADKLRLGKGASAQVHCNNLKTWNLKTQGEFQVSQGCPTKTVQNRKNQTTSPTRAANDPTVPYLISPRNSAILTGQPMFRWNPVKGATSYEVEVTGPDVDWKTTVKQPQVAYSGKQTLKAGYRYWVTVKADNGVSSESEGFTVLSDANAQRVKAEIAQLQQQRLNNQAKTIALAYVYRSNDLNADAIDLLTGFIQQGNKTTSVHQLLASLYQQVGLVELARERYLTALELAKQEQNLPAQAIIQASLGEVSIALDNLPQAQQWFSDAQGSYRALGDEGKVRELQKQLDYLKGRV